MSRQVYELETVLQALIEEHTNLLSLVERQQAAMKVLDLRGMDEMTRLQETSRMRVGSLENRRQALVQTIARAHRMSKLPTLPELASLYPPAAPRLLKLREQLKDVMVRLATRSHIAGRVAAAVLGHLNTVVRVVAGAVEKAGLYTRSGVPQVSSRIGVIEAVG